MDASLWTYPWDLQAEGVEPALRRIRDWGRMNAVSLTANYHTSKCLSPHNPQHRVIFNEDSALQFVPRPERYGRIQPRVSTLAREADVWGQAVRAAADLGLQLRAWTICNHGTWLGQRYPDCTVHNAFGDEIVHNLCPANPDVRHYVTAVVADLTAQYPIDAVELEAVGFLGFRHNFHHEKIGIPLDAWQSFLLGLCFCEHCKRAAHQRGVDADRVQATVRSLLTGYFDADLPLPESDDSMLEATRLTLENDDFRGYLNARLDTVTSMVKGIKQAVAAQAPATRIICLAEAHDNWRDGMDLEALARIVDGFIAFYTYSGKEMASKITRLRLLLGQDAKIGAAINGTYPWTAQAGDVAERFHACRAIGVEAFNFYNYGLMKLPTLRAIGELIAAAKH